MKEKKQPTKPTASAIENMKRAAKAMRKEDGLKHSAALELVAQAHGYASWRDVTTAAAILVAATDPAVRRPELAGVMAEVQRVNPSWSTNRILTEAKVRCAGLARVASRTHPTPPVGTPGVGRHGGNSAPAVASLAGVQKSERSGERQVFEVNGPQGVEVNAKGI